jgi:uncharacterized membrane protein
MRLWMDRRVRILFLALALTCMSGWLFKTHCTPGGWTESEQYTSGCYSDAVPFWTAREVDKGKIPYFQTRMEYPVLTGAAIWLEGGATRLLLGRHANASHFLGAVTLVNALLAFLVLWMFWRAGMDRARLWAWALAPPLVLYLGHNWDMLAVSFAVAAMLLARQGRLVRAAATAGLGVAAKLYPILLLPMLGLAALFEAGRGWRQRFIRAASLSGAAVGAWLLVNLPVALLAPENWSEFYRFSQERGGTAAAIWEVLVNMGWLFTWAEQRNGLSALLFCTGAAVIVGLGWRRHCGQPWVLFAPVLAWFLLTSKVWSPQFDLWLYPMLLLTAPRLWPVGLFVLGDIGAYFVEFWWFAGNEGAWPAATYTHIALAAAFRATAMLWLIADAVRLYPPEWIGRAPIREAAA